MDSSLAEGNQCAGTSFSTWMKCRRNTGSLTASTRKLYPPVEGVSTLVSFEPGVVAQAPIRPVYYNTGWLMLIGSLLGLIVGGVVVQKLPVK